MAKVLRGLGFEVIEKHDLDQKGMKRAIRDFGKKLAQGGVGLFYYAGHGMQVAGRNYLIPLGAQIEGEADVDIESVYVGQVLAKMENAKNRLNIVILDACRDNPFARSWRSANRGLAFSSAPTGTLIAYATAPGGVAADGKGRNSTFTEALARHLKHKGLAVEKVFKAVRTDVIEATDGKQTPWESSSLQGEFYFNVPDNAMPAAEKLVCPSGATLQGGRCIAEVVCPDGAVLKRGRCILPVHQPTGPVTTMFKTSVVTQRAPSYAFGTTPVGYQLSSLSLLNQMLARANTEFYDPQRIKPRTMMSSALDAVSLDLAAIEVEGAQTASSRTLVVGRARHKVRLDDVTSITQLSLRMSELARFLEDNLDASAIRLPYIEYSLINGMLLPLSMHSNLIDPVR